MRLKILGLALAVLTLAVLSAGAAMAEDDSDSSSSQFKNAKIINTVAPPRRATYPTAPRTRGRAYLPPPVFANQTGVSNQAAPAETAPPMASAPESPSTVLRGRRVPTSPAGRMRPLANTPAAAMPHAAVMNAPAAPKAPVAVANCPVPALANTSAEIDNATAPETTPSVEVSVKEGLASVKIVNTPMPAALNALAKEGGFTVKLYGNTPDQRISTEFSGMDLERAAIRIMGLAGMKSYFFHYDDKGALTLLETFAAVGGVKTLPNTPVRRPVATHVTRPQIPVPGAERQRPTRSVRPPISEEPAFNDQFDNQDNSDTDSDSEEPVYTPPTPRRR